jgi:hypothetical protein
MLKQRGSTIIALVIIFSVIALVAMYFGYEKYQQDKLFKQAQVESLIAEQKQLVLEQRILQGHLPEKIIPPPLERQAVVERPTLQVRPPIPKDFRCDGREHCSQMRSYEEAVFFNQYCPNTKMDGDRDGIPCEDQFKR